MEVKIIIKLDEDLIYRFIKMYPKWLNQREQQVIEMRYCLNGQSWKTLQQIGDMLGVCRERVRQIEKKALRKLKHPSRIKALLRWQLADSRRSTVC
jgi:RNA polymerase sigma factor (sigma-70 family)